MIDFKTHRKLNLHYVNLFLLILGMFFLLGYGFSYHTEAQDARWQFASKFFGIYLYIAILFSVVVSKIGEHNEYRKLKTFFSLLPLVSFCIGMGFLYFEISVPI